MTRPRARRPLLVLAAVLAGATTGPLAPAAAAPAAAPAPAAATALRADDPAPVGGLPVQVQVDSISPPGALERDGKLVITGRIVNRGDRPLTGVELRLRHRSGRLDSRQEVRDWLAGSGSEAGSVGAPVGAPLVPVQGKPLAPGAAFRFTTQPATPADLGLLGTRFGPRGLALEVVAGTDRARVGLYRTAVVWMPSRSFEPTPLALVAPVTAATPSTDAGALGPGLLTELAPDGRLSRLLAATACRQGCPVDWAIDPALLAAAAAGPRAVTPAAPTGTPTASAGGTAAGGTPAGTPAAPTGATGGSTSGGAATTPSSGTGTGGSTGTAAATGDAWLKALLAGRAGRETWLLPFADPDVAALAHAGTPALLRLAQARARATATATLGTPPSAALAWPASGLADPATLALYRASGHTVVVLDGSAVPPVEPNGNTLSAAAQLTAGPGTLRGLLYDRALSDAFAATGGADAVGSTQRLLAELAAVTLERPYDPQPQVVVAPRGWDPQPKGVQAALTALTAAPWVDLTRLGTITAARPGEPARRPAGYPARARAEEVPADQVRAIGQADGRLTRFATALVDPAGVVGPRRDLALSLLSVSWRTDRSAQAAATTALVGDVKDLTEGPVVEGGPFNLLTGSGELPLRVRNPHPFALKVELTLRPRSGRLVTDQRTQLQLPAGATRRVLVKVRSVADGTVAVDSLLSSPTGVLVGPPTTLTVRIHRNWETRGIGVLAVGLGLIFLIGLFRSVRRGRTRVPPQDVPDVDDLELYGPAEVPPPDPFVTADRIRPDDPSTSPQTLDLTAFPAAPGRAMPLPEPPRVPAQRSLPLPAEPEPGPSRPWPERPTSPGTGSSRR